MSQAEWFDDPDYRYPGFRQMVAKWRRTYTPPCPYCRSEDTARVSDGIDPVSKQLAKQTRKIRLLPHGHPADFYCNACYRYFDSWGQTVDIGGLLVTANRPRTSFETHDCFVEVFNPGGTTLPWDPTQLHAFDDAGKKYELATDEPYEDDDEDDEDDEDDDDHDWLANYRSKGPLLLVVKACELGPRVRVQDYVCFPIDDYRHLNKLVFGPVDAPLATWMC